jgi:predicted transcriptional regulator
MAAEGHAPLVAGRLPLDEVREALEHRSAYFNGIEAAAEAFVGVLPSGDVATGLADWLRRERGIAVRILPVHVMPDLRRRFDRHSMRLFVSERLSAPDRMQEIAVEVATLALRDAIDASLDELSLSSPEAMRIARFELARYAALALMMPYAAFLAAAQATRYDIDILSARFGVSFAQAATRLTMLQRPGASGISFFLMEIDAAGHTLRRAGAQGFPHRRFGGGCPKLNIHAAFLQPGQVLCEVAEMADGAAFLTVARTLEGPAAEFGERVRRTALLLGCDAAARDGIVYGRAGMISAFPLAIGPACRLCERRGCLARAEPPVTRPFGLDERVTGLSVFDFQ